jgi:hypothetical protein
LKSKIPISISHPKLLKDWDYDLNELSPDTPFPKRVTAEE